MKLHHMIQKWQLFQTEITRVAISRIMFGLHQPHETDVCCQ